MLKPQGNPQFSGFEFRELGPDEKPKANEIQVTQEHKDFIEALPQEERIKLWQNLKSKNRTAQKRARKKIASASRARNR